MSQQVVITITTGSEALQSIKSIFLKPVSNFREEARSISNYFIAVESGLKQATADVQVNGGTAVAASDTLTFSGVSTASDTILINGVTLTAVASGAVNNQWNVKGSAALQAVEVARAINASSTSLVSGQVVASVVGAVVTITAVVKGITGNAITTAKGVDAGSVMTFSAARLSGGAAASANVYHYGL